MNKILMLAILVTVTTTGCQNKSDASAAAPASQSEASTKQVDPQDSSSEDIVNGDSNSEVKN